MNTINRLAALFVFLVVVAGAHPALAKNATGDEIFGVGVQLGDPVAVTAKLLPVPVFGFQAYVGGGDWDADGYYNTMFVTGIDVIFHPWMIYDGWKTCALNLTIGGGAALGLFRGWWHDGYVGPYPYNDPYYRDNWYASMFVRLVTGVSLWFKPIPLELFVEANPAIRLFRPDPVAFHMFWTAIGARWWF